VGLRVLVTGATGFLGSHVARSLAAGGATLRILHRPESPTELIEHLAADEVIGDILRPETLAAACQGMDAVIHCAAQMGGRVSPAMRLRSHVTGTHNLLQAALQAGVRRFVYTSSVAALGIPDQRPAATDDGVRPRDERDSWHGAPSQWPYGFAKLQAEKLVRQATGDGLEAVIVNPSLVIGPGDRRHGSNVLVWNIMRGRVPPLVPGGLNVVDVQDVTAGYVAALERGRPGERYLLCGENRTLSDLITTTARLVGRRPPRVRLSLRAARTIGSVLAGAARTLHLPLSPDLLELAGLYFYYSGEKARRELGLGLPRPYESSASASAEWYRRRALP
jgi:dihydroflavonol-4-reductase